MACGWMIKTLQDHHWSALETYHLVFWVYAAAGILKFMLSAMLSKDSEKNPHKKGIIAGDETEPLLAPNKDKNSSPSARLHISKATRRFLLNISLFFALDSLGVGMASNTWIIYFVKSKFQLDDRILGFIFSSSDLLEGLSNVMAIPSVRRIGLVKSIVLGGILSSPALILLPFPRHIAGTVALLLARAMFVEFHQPARQTFISQSVLPDERTAVIGVLTVVRTVAQSPGPAITGQLAQHNLLWLSFTIAGGIKLFYSVLFSISFSNTDIRESAQG